MPLMRSAPYPLHSADCPTSTAQMSRPAHAPVKRLSGGHTSPDVRPGWQREHRSIERQGLATTSSYHVSGRPIGSGGGRAGRAVGISVGRPRWLRQVSGCPSRTVTSRQPHAATASIATRERPGFHTARAQGLQSIQGVGVARSAQQRRQQATIRRHCRPHITP